MAPAPTFDAVVAAVQQRAWYLRCRGPGPGTGHLPVGAGWIRADRLLASPDLVARLLAQTGAARGAARPPVAAALFVQAYAFQVAGVAVAAWALGLPSPTLDPARLAVRVGPARPDDLAVATCSLTAHTAPSLAAALLTDHLEPLVAAVRTTARVGERALWGNVAASVAAVLRSVDGPEPGGDAGVRARAAQLYAAHPHLGGLGAWAETDDGAWRWQRRSCCLWFRTTEADGRRCDDCTLGRTRRA